MKWRCLRPSSTPMWGRGTSLLELGNIDAFHGNVQALWSISLSMKEGDLVSLGGSNAIGKSKLVSTVAMLQPPGRKDPLPGE